MRQHDHNRQHALRHGLAGAAIALGFAVLLGAGPQATRKVPNLPNASAQRLALLKAMERVDERLESLEEALTSGEVVVKVSEIPEMTIAE